MIDDIETPAPAPKPKPAIDYSKLPCPKGFPPEKWEKRESGFKRGYLNAVYHSVENYPVEEIK